MPRPPGCVACAAGVAAEHQFEAALLDADEPTRSEAPPCLLHARRLLHLPRGPAALVGPLSQACAVAATGLEARSPVSFVWGCSVCGARRDAEMRVIAECAADPHAHRTSEPGDGPQWLCWRHVRVLLAACGPDRGERLRWKFERRLAHGRTMELVAGADVLGYERRDRRGELLAASLTASPPDQTTTLSASRERLALATCPVCAARAAAEVSHIAWLRTAIADAPEALRTEVAWLCPAHLHDLAVADEPGGAWMALLLASGSRAALLRLAEAAAALPRATLRARFASAARRLHEPTADGGSWPARIGQSVRALAGARRRGWRRAAEHLLAPQPCATCTAAQTVTARQLDLFAAVLEDGPAAERLRTAHGLCRPHALALGGGLGAVRARARLREQLQALASPGAFAGGPARSVAALTRAADLLSIAELQEE